MGYFSKFVGVCAAVTLLSVAVVGAEEKDPLKPRVAPDQMADAKAMKNPAAIGPMPQVETLASSSCGIL